jgi:hypothetical protein
MENQRFIQLIGARANDQSIRDIISNLEVKTNKDNGFICRLIYFISICRRVYNQVDNPISVQYTTKDEFDSNIEWMETQVSKMNDETQTTIFICVKEIMVLSYRSFQVYLILISNIPVYADIFLFCKIIEMTLCF